MLGKTFAYSGTLEEGTITTTCPHGKNTVDVGMRFAQFAIVEGQNTGVIRYDAWVAAPNETNFYPDAMSSDQDYFEMMISPLGENNFVLDGDLIAPFEWTSEGEGSEPQVLGRNENVSNVKATGANYFRYAGKYFMVTPKVNEEGKVAGIELFDISEGFSAAKAVELIGGDIERRQLRFDPNSDDQNIKSLVVLLWPYAPAPMPKISLLTPTSNYSSLLTVRLTNLLKLKLTLLMNLKKVVQPTHLLTHLRANSLTKLSLSTIH